MEINFQEAKNGERTALIGNLYLHSAYNPQREAERFLDNLKVPFNSKIIIITEPGLSYILPGLKKTFPNCKIGLIRYIKGFEDYNDGFDLIFNYFEHSNNFDNYLLNQLGEENLLETFFCQWDPSSKIFSQINTLVWQNIKKALENSKTLLITRQYFEKKWLINTFNFIRYLKRPITIKKNINLPLLIIASGSSLKAFIKKIKDNQEKFFIIVLSSAVKACIENKINADLILSTDGGYWAGQHLKSLFKNSYRLGISPESYIPKKLILNKQIVPLLYSDGLSNKVLGLCNMPVNIAKRNATISGTALDFGLDFFTQDIYFCGLDLATRKGYQHIQKNELELNSCICDNKINSLEKRSIRSQFSGASLEIYKDWFKNKNLTGRKVFRLINDDEKQNDLGMIKDINLESFDSLCKKLSVISKNDIFSSGDYSYNKEVLNNFLNNDFNDIKCKKQIYPLDYVLLCHDPDNKEVLERIEKNHNKLYKKLWRILND